MKAIEETWEAWERGPGKWHVCPVGEDEIATFWEETGEAPRLAAAAPELYRALDNLLNVTSPHTEDEMAAVHAAFAAIAKARGE